MMEWRDPLAPARPPTDRRAGSPLILGASPSRRAAQDRVSARGPPRGCRLCGRRPRRCGPGTGRRGPWRVPVEGFGRAGAGSESPSMDSEYLFGNCEWSWAHCKN